MDNKITKTFGKRLKELRIEKGLSIERLAEDVGIGKSSISRWENAQAYVYAIYVVRLAQYFNVSVDYLLGLEN